MNAATSVSASCAEATYAFVSAIPECRAGAALARDAVTSMCSQMPARLLSEGPRARRHMSPDGTPMDLSLRVGHGSPEVRWALWDLTEHPRDADASRRLLDVLAARHGAYIGEARRILDSLPPRDEGLVAVGGAVSAAAQVTMQAYIMGNASYTLQFAESHGPPGFAAQLEAALHDDLLGFIACDLVATPQARSKIYVNLRGFEPSRLAGYRDLAADRWPIDSLGAMSALYGEVPTALGEYSGPHLCFHLQDRRLAAATLYLPCLPSWFDLATGGLLTDGEFQRRIHGLLGQAGLPTASYDAALRALSNEDLDSEVWIHRFVSFVRARGELSTTVYFSPRFYRDTFGVG